MKHNEISVNGWIDFHCVLGRWMSKILRKIKNYFWTYIFNVYKVDGLDRYGIIAMTELSMQIEFILDFDIYILYFIFKFMFVTRCTRPQRCMHIGWILCCMYQKHRCNHFDGVHCLSIVEFCRVFRTSGHWKWYSSGLQCAPVNKVRRMYDIPYTRRKSTRNFYRNDSVHRVVWLLAKYEYELVHWTVVFRSVNNAHCTCIDGKKKSCAPNKNSFSFHWRLNWIRFSIPLQQHPTRN